ncbi:hypothetical protein KKF60_02220 [Patescibacteria group bacterium]|nr:hypothetical protein [Patescibacteria group bacterium]MBU4458684.1 hypothetical protein [Patescibacteria group bacterium]MCG2696279.1 hypothetical protein [Candidatus Portnoybacteria bacterium]
MTTQSITSGQQKQVKRFAEDAVDRAIAEGLLDKDGIQKLIENGDEFQADITVSIKKHSLSNQFADEEVKSSYGYLSGYKPKGITEQTNILRQLFPGAGFADEKLAQQPLPPNAEGWFAIPRWQSVAKTYNEAVQKVLDLIKKQRDGNFYNHREGRIGEQYLRQHERTAKKLQMLGNQQTGFDILVVASQFGLRHRGRSVRRAREVFTGNEFGLGAFKIGCMILTHPERLQHYDDPWIDCAGDEYAPAADGDFSRAPCFSFSGGEVRFGTDWVGSASAHYGSASGFLQQ